MLVDSADNHSIPKLYEGPVEMPDIQIFEIMKKSAVAQIKALGGNIAEFSLLGRNHKPKPASTYRSAA